MKDFGKKDRTIFLQNRRPRSDDDGGPGWQIVLGAIAMLLFLASVGALNWL